MGSRTWITLGSVAGAAAVACGAFGAHALKERLDPQELNTWTTAVHYHLLHSLALVCVGIMAEREKRVNLSGWAFALGILCFSGSLYWLALGGPRWLGPVTPFGGLAFIVGWLGLVRGVAAR